MIDRVAPDATIGEAQSQVDAHNASIEQDSPEARMMRDAGFRSIVVPLHADHVAAIRPTLLLLQAGVLFLLLIGAVNVTNLLLMQRAVRAIDSELPVNDLRSMETRIADSLVARRSPALLAGLFSTIALLLTAIGLRRIDLRRLAASPRNRPADGARRAARAGSPAVHVARATAAGGGDKPRRDWRLAHGPRHAVHSLRDAGASRGDGGRARGRVDRGVPAAIPPRRAYLTDGSA